MQKSVFISKVILTGALLFCLITPIFFSIGIMAGVFLFHNKGAMYGILFIPFIIPYAFIVGLIVTAILVSLKRRSFHRAYRIFIIIAALAFSYFMGISIGIFLFAYFLAAALIVSYLLTERYYRRLKSHIQVDKPQDFKHN